MEDGRGHRRKHCLQPSSGIALRVGKHQQWTWRLQFPIKENIYWHSLVFRCGLSSLHHSILSQKRMLPPQSSNSCHFPLLIGLLVISWTIDLNVNSFLKDQISGRTSYHPRISWQRATCKQNQKPLFPGLKNPNNKTFLNITQVTFLKKQWIKKCELEKRVVKSSVQPCSKQKTIRIVCSVLHLRTVR